MCIVILVGCRVQHVFEQTEILREVAVKIRYTSLLEIVHHAALLLICTFVNRGIPCIMTNR